MEPNWQSCRKNTFTMPHRGLDLERITIFFLYKIFCKWQWGLDWNDVNFQDSQMEESWNSPRLLFCKFISPSYGVWFKIFLKQSCNSWKENFNGISNAPIKSDWIPSLYIFMVEYQTTNLMPNHSINHDFNITNCLMFNYSN